MAAQTPLPPEAPLTPQHRAPPLLCPCGPVVALTLLQCVYVTVTLPISPPCGLLDGGEGTASSLSIPSAGTGPDRPSVLGSQSSVTPRPQAPRGPSSPAERVMVLSFTR